MDVRREARQIYKHFTRYHKDIGEALVYYRFDADNSTYDTVYDEAYRRYHVGVRIPILWVDQTEATEDYTSEGRRPTQRLRCAVSAQDMHEAGFSVTEVVGNRLQDTSPSDIWRRDRHNDIVFYDSRYFEISAYQIRGRLQGEDVIIGLTCIETFPDDDMVFDYKPGVIPTPAPTPLFFSDWTFNPEEVYPDPGIGHWAWDVDHTTLRVSLTDSDGTDRVDQLGTVETGDEVFLRSTVNEDVWQRYTIWSVGGIFAGTNWYEFGVTLLEAGPTVIPPAEGDLTRFEFWKSTSPTPVGFGVGPYGSGPYGGS